MKVSRDFLRAELEKALTAETTEDCRDGACQNCGVCDFKQIQPQIYPPSQTRMPAVAEHGPTVNQATLEKLVVTFAKTDAARFLGHLEMANIFKRALRRAGISLHYSQGFHPNPKMTFEDTLPLGMESLCERLIITLRTAMAPAQVMRRLRPQLPEGFSIIHCEPFKRLKDVEVEVVYRIQLDGEYFSRQLLEDYTHCDHFHIQRRNRKGRLKKIDLKAMLKSIRMPRSDMLEVTLRQQMDALVRPNDLLRHLFKLDPDVIKHARVIKLSTHYYSRLAAASRPTAEHAGNQG